MSVYADIADVQALIAAEQWTPSATSYPTEATAQRWLDSFESEVEAKICRNVTTPVTGIKSVEIMRDSIVAPIVAARVWRVVFGGQTEVGQQTYADIIEGPARELLQSLIDGEKILPDASYIEDPSEAPHASPESPYEDMDASADVIDERMFARDDVW